MSKSIDSRVVEMRFDNKQFESNVEKSMSTLDKLKQSLRFDGLSNGLGKVNDAVNKVNFNPIGEGIEAVKVKFSALEVMAVSALSNITNSAMNTAKNLVKAFTIDPVATGLQEYETQINAVQTILANTQHNGTTIDEVNAALDELNHYADKTIYNFTEMTRNIGTFTAAGVELGTSVESIKGIANLAAISGSTSQQASTAMYQLSQALAAGKVSLMDWNSVVNAGMGGKVFQDALVRTSELLGTGANEAIEMYGNFRESLTKSGWLTTEVLTETLKQFAGAYSKADLIQQGFTEEQAESIANMAVTAEDAATKVKTFTQLMDTLKEAVQSGWTQSFEIIIGDFEEAKAMWTNVSDFFGGIIENVSNARNYILESAFGRNFAKMSDGLKSLLEPVETIKTSINSLGESLEDLESIANRVINGEFGNMQERWSKLTELGYDWAEVQNKVNEKLGFSKRYATESANAQNKNTKSIENQNEAQADLTETQDEYIESLTKLSRSELAKAGFTSDQIYAIRTLKNLSEKTGLSISELIKNIDNLNGRWLMLEGIKNFGKSIINVFNSIKDAWALVMNPLTKEDKASKLFDFIAAFHKLSKSVLEFTSNENNIEKITSTFKGLFSIISLVKNVVSGGLQIAFKIISGVLSNLNIDILDVTASIGEALYGFNKWIEENKVITQVVYAVAGTIAGVIIYIRDMVKAFFELDSVKGIISDFKEYFEDVYTTVGEFIGRVKELDGLTINNIKIAFDDFVENVLGKLLNFDGRFKNLKAVVKGFSDAFEEFVMSKINKPLETTLGNLSTFKDRLVAVFSNLGTKLKNEVGMGEILTTLLGSSLVYILAKGGGIIGPLGDLAEKIGSVVESVKKAIDGFTGTLKAFTLSIKAKAILSIAGAIAILAASIWVLCQIPPAKMWSSVGAIAVLGTVLVGLSFAIGKINSAGEIKISASSIGSLIGMAAAIGILVLTMKSLETLKEATLLRNIGIISLFVIELGAFAYIMATTKKNIAKGSIALVSMAAAVKVMVSALSDMDKLYLDNVKNDILIILGIIVTLTLISLALSKLGNGLSAGIAIISMAVSLKLIINALSDIADLRLNKIKDGLEPLKQILFLFMCILAVSALAGKNAAKAGVGILAMSASIYILIGAFKLFAGMDASGIEKAKGVITQLLIVFGIVTALSNFAGEYAAKAGVMLVLMAGAMLALTVVAATLSYIDASRLNKAVGAMSILMILMGLLVACTGFASGVNAGPFIALGITLGVLMVALGTISMIDQTNLYSAVGAMSIIMGMLAVVIAASKLVGEATKSLVAITIAIGLIGGILIAMSLLNVENALVNAGAISLALLAMAASFAIISKSGELSTKALVSLGIMTAVVVAIGAVLWGMSALDTESALINAAGIAAVLLAMAFACKIMQGIPVDGAITAAGSLAAFVFILSGIMAGILTVFGLIEDTSLIEHGMEVLSKIGYGIGQFVGSIIGGFADGTMSGLPAIGQHLTDFMTNLEGFINGVNGIDAESMQGAKFLAEAILMLCGAELVNGLAAFISKLFTGENDLGAFSEKITDFGDAMKKYANSVKGVDWSGVEPSVNAANKIIQLAKIIPNSGGALGALVGNNDLDDFGIGLAAFGGGLIQYAHIVAGTDWSGVAPSVPAANKIIELAEIIPNSGGVLGAIVGNNDLDDFGTAVEAFGDGLAKYARKVAGVKWDGINPSVNAAYKINELINNLPTTEEFYGKMSLTKFGDQLKDFADDFSGFAEKIESLDVSKLSIAVNNITDLASLLNDVSKYDFSGTSSFVTSLNELGTAGIDAIVEAFQNGSGRVMLHVHLLCEDIRSNIADETLPICGQFTVMLDDIANTILEEGHRIINAFNSVITYAKDEVSKKGADFKALGQNLITSLVRGVNFGKTSIVNSIKLLINNAISAISIDDFYEAGANAAKGFANGIRDNCKESETQAKLMAESTIDSAKETLDIHSPSRVFRTIGKYVVEGMALGIKDNAKLPYEAAKFVSNNLLSIVDETASKMTYGSGAMKAYLKQYGEFTLSVADNTEVVKKASESVKNYAKALYEESDQYKQDKKQLEEDKKSLSELCAKREELRKQINGTAKDAKKTLTTTTTTNKAIEKSYSSVTEVTSETSSKIGEFYSNVSEKVTDFCDRMGIKLGDLKDKFTEFCKNHGLSLDNLISKYGSFENVMQSGEGFVSDFVNELNPLNTTIDTGTNSVSSLNSELENLDKEIEQAKNKVIEDEKAMAEHTEEAFNNMRDSIKDNIESAIDFLSVSLDTGVDLFTKMDKSLNNIDPFSKFDDGSNADGDGEPVNILENMESQLQGVTKWKDNIEELARRGLGKPLLNYLKELGPQGIATVRNFMNMTAQELQKANDYYAQILTIDTTNYDILGTMESQIDGVKEWKANLETLKESGLCDGLIKQLEEMGPEGADKVRAFLQLTGEELAKANEYYEESMSLSADQFLENYSKKLNAQINWAEGLKELAERGFDQGVVEALAEAGQESGQAVLDTFLAMTPEQMAEVNKKYGQALSIPDDAADSIMATCIEAGEKSTEAFGEGIESNSEKSEKSAVEMSTKSADAIVDKTKSKWTGAGVQMIMGFIKGLTSKTGLLQKYVTQVGKVTIDTFKKVLNIHSPSRVFMGLGEYVTEGLAIGISNAGSEVDMSMSQICNSAISNAESMILGINEAMRNKALDMPTISPVVRMDDMSSVSKLNVTPMIDAKLNEPIQTMSDVIFDMQRDIARNNDMITSAIGKFTDSIAEMNSEENRQEISLYVDSKKMASTLAKPMSRQFNVMSKRGI